MRVRRLPLHLGLVLLGIAFVTGIWGCGSEKVRFVARVGNNYVTQEEFEKAFLKEKPVYVAQHATLEEKRRFLQKMLDKKLEYLAALQKGIDREEPVREKLEAERNRILYFATMDKQVVYKIITEEMMRDFYRRSRVEVRARHILFKVPADATPQQVEEARKKAQEVIHELQNGADFAELAKKYSEDRATRERGGDLGFIRWGRMEQPILDAVFKMGKYQFTTEPVRTSRGFHVIQVTDRRIVPQKPFEIEKSNIAQTLFQKHRKEIMELYDRFNQELERRYRVRYLEANIDSMARYFARPEVDSIMRSFEWVSRIQLDWMEPGMRNLPLAQIEGKPYTIEDMFKQVKQRASGSPVMPIHTPKQLREMLQSEVRIALAIRFGQRRRYLHQSPYREEFQKKKEEILRSIIRQRELLDKIEITEDLKKKYYEDHKDNYKVPAKARVQEILVKDVTLANQIAEWAKAGRNFDRLAEKYNVRITTKNKKGHLGWLTRNSYGPIGRNALEMKVGEIRGPIRYGKNYSIIKVLERTEETVQPYEEVKDRVESDLRKELLRRREEDWKHELRKIFPARIYLDNLEKALKEIRSRA
jgi:parvulin-like peptidyl-prolyl isomerase